ncbi:MAG: hypothetical protein MK010_08835 [Erythrobacter sp.]|nr:hypothetical protein [Erythrobacter sp.]
MTTVFIAGSIAIKRLHGQVVERIEKAVAGGLSVVVGDADGADTAIQEALVALGADRVTVYCSGEIPRNNRGQWPTNPVFPLAAPGTRAFFTAKDVEMAEDADYGLMIWDSKSTGTLSNVMELLAREKKSVVFVNKAKTFVTVASVAHLRDLLTHMSDHARQKAEQKIGLSKRIAALGEVQIQLL